MAEATPRFRRDLEARPGTADGISFVDVSDPLSGHSFRFYDFEFALAEQLDGRPLAEVVVWMGETYGMELTVDGLRPFIHQLADLGFLAPPAQVGEGGAPVPSIGAGAASPASPLEDGSPEMVALSTAPTPVGSYDPRTFARSSRPSAGPPAASSRPLPPSPSSRSLSARRPPPSPLPASPLPTSAVPSLPPLSVPRSPAGSGAAALARARARTETPRPPVPALPSLSSVSASGLPAPSLPWLGEADAQAVSELAFSALTGQAVQEDRGRGGTARARSSSPTGDGRPSLRALSDLLPAPIEPARAEPAPVVAPAAEEVPGEPASGENIHGDSAHGETAHGESAHGESVGDESATLAVDAAGGPSDSRTQAIERLTRILATDEELTAESESLASHLARASATEHTGDGERSDDAGDEETPFSEEAPTRAERLSAMRAATTGEPAQASAEAAVDEQRVGQGHDDETNASAEAAGDASTEEAALREAAAISAEGEAADPLEREARQSRGDENAAAESAPALESAEPLERAAAAVHADWAHALARDVDDDAPRPVRAAAAPAAPARREPSGEVVPRPARQARWPWVVGAAAATVAAGLLYMKQNDEVVPVVPVNAPSVHVVVPAPATIYRWFDAQGIVVPGEDKGLSFEVPGRVQETFPPGTSFSAGEVLAKLVGFNLREKDLNYARSRLVFYQQLLETAVAQKNEPQIRFNKTKIEEKKRNVERAEAAWRRYVITADAPGEIGAIKIKAGEKATPGAVVLEVRANGPHAELPLTATESAQARELAFCRIETLPTPQASARAAECSLPTEPPRGKAFVVDLPRNAGFTVGQPVRLARARFEGVFAVPRAALRDTPLGSQVFVVAQPGGMLRARTVRVADLGAEEALVAAGLSVGDQVVDHVAPELADGVMVRVTP